MKHAAPLSFGISLILLAACLSGGASAQEPPPFPFQAGLGLDNGIYRVVRSGTSCDNVVIRAKLALSNTGGDLYVPAGFSGKPFLLSLLFTNPAGKEIASDALSLALEAESKAEKTHAGPPRILFDEQGEPQQVEQVEVLPAGWYLESSIDDVGPLYVGLGLSQCPAPGWYTVRAVIPMRTYPGTMVGTDPRTGTMYARVGSSDWSGNLVSNTVAFAVSADSDNDGYLSPADPFHLDAAGNPLSDCDDGNPDIHPGAAEIPCNGRDDDCDPATADSCPSSGTLNVKAERHVVGAGSYPGSAKFPIPSLLLKVFSKANACVSKYSFSWQNYAAIWGCGVQDPNNTVATILTDGAGNGTLTLSSGDYLLIGLYNPDGVAASGDEIYIGSGAGVVEGQSVSKYLQVIEKADGKRVAGKNKIIPGSELMIIEPEYVEWTGTQELYPFLFQSIGDWGVTTSITPPEGFVADHPSLAAEVNTDVKSVQFVVTDVGSHWTDTKVEHKVKHKNRVQIVPSHVGVVKKEKGKKKK